METKTIPVVGMACAGCAANVERHLNQLEGITSAAVNFAARTALVSYDPKTISLQQMKEAILKAGFDLVVEEDRSVEEIEKNAFRQLRRRVVVSWILALLAMSISMGWISMTNDNIRNQTLFVRLSVPALRADLSMRRQEFVKLLNEYVGSQVIADIRFN